MKPERLEIGLQSLAIETLCTCFTVFLGESRCSHDYYYLGITDILFRVRIHVVFVSYLYHTDVVLVSY